MISIGENIFGPFNSYQVIKNMKNFQLLLLIFFSFAIEKIQPFEKQSIAKNNYFSTRVDDKFDDLILSIKVLRPSFLHSPKRSINIDLIYEINDSFNMTITDFSVRDGRIFILESQGISIIETKSSWEPFFLQRVLDTKLKFFKKITVGEFIVAFKPFLFYVYAMEDGIYLVKLAEIRTREEIFDIEIKKGKIIVFLLQSIQVYILKDLELRLIVKDEDFVFKDKLLREAYMMDVYVDDNYIFIIDGVAGLMKFSYFPIKFESQMKIEGYRIAGYGDTLLIDGKEEINIYTLEHKNYPLNYSCYYVEIDSFFVYCYGESFFIAQSRFLPVFEVKTTNYLLSFAVSDSQVFLAYSDCIFVYKVEISNLMIEGKAPGSVKEYKVEFQIESFNNNLTESFILAVQYSFSDVIIFIFICFIAIFFLIFACSWIWSLFKTATTETEVKITPPTTENVSSDRNIFSDRNLIIQE